MKVVVYEVGVDGGMKYTKKVRLVYKSSCVSKIYVGVYLFRYRS